MLPKAESYDEVCRRFRWAVPDAYNIGVDVCDKWAGRTPDRPAIIEVREDGPDRTVTFAELRALSNQTANLLTAHGIAPRRPGRHPAAAGRRDRLQPYRGL